MASAAPFVDAKIRQRNIMLFSKSYSPECKMVKSILDEYELKHNVFEVVEIEKRQDCKQIEDYFQILCLTDSRSVPQLFVKGKYIGGEKEIPIMHESGELKKLLTQAATV